MGGHQRSGFAEADDGGRVQSDLPAPGEARGPLTRKRVLTRTEAKPRSFNKPHSVLMAGAVVWFRRNQGDRSPLDELHRPIIIPLGRHLGSVSFWGAFSFRRPRHSINGLGVLLRAIVRAGCHVARFPLLFALQLPFVLRGCDAVGLADVPVVNTRPSSSRVAQQGNLDGG